MLDITTLIFIFNFTLAVFVVLKHKTSLSFLYLSYLYIFVFIFIGSYFSIGRYDWWLRDVSDNNILIAFYITNIYMLVHGTVLLNIKPYKINLPTNYIAGIEVYLFPMILISSLIIVVLFLFPTSALKALLFDGNISAIYLAELRGSGSVLNTENILMLYFKNIILRYFVLYIFIYYSIVYFSLNRYKNWFYISLFIVILTSILSLSKGPVINIIILIIIIRIILGYKVNFIKYFLIIFSILILLYIFIMGSENAFLALESILHRIFMAQYFGFPMSLELFPTGHDYLGLSGLSGIVSKILGIQYHSFSRLIMEFGNQWGVQAGTAGFMSTFYLAEGYAYNGIFGIILVTFVTLCFFYILDNFSKNIKSNYLLLSLFILVIFIFSKMTVDSFSSIILNYSLYILGILVVFLNMLNIKYKRKK